MGQIEELPDDYDESQPPPTPAPSSAAKAASEAIPSSLLSDQNVPFPIKPEKVQNADPLAPELPPAMASIRSYTPDQLADMMNKTPLFMTDLDNAGDEEGENVMLEAIRALQYEGTRGEVALSFREQGNEAAKAKNWVDAKEFYTKAIAVLNVKKEDDKWEKPTDLEKEEKILREAREACYANRALCNLELKNYRSTTLDCAQALKVNPRNVKAHYRSSMALLALDKLAEATDTVTRGLAIDPDNKSLHQVSEKICARKSILDKIAARKAAEEETKRKEKQLLSTALQARTIRVRRTDAKPDMEDAKIALTPDPLSPESTLVFPVMFLYPMDAQTDFIKAFGEMDCINDHLEYLLPLPWDMKQEYQLETVNCYMETITGGLIKVGKKLPLLQVLSGGKVEVVDELVKIVVVPKGKEKRFIEEFKARKGKD
ncbi:TPR repeat protein [Talaromyces stipitatus ATCC 10500]|uniref:TPR repeat protein n=1 Tax=Talaromyces stipitatus (strain ATCC 10500 / CBS 375.48 / QM 6759 / NRRL 1006) TaxID=441959 RepID=B8LZ76_TALSN|nr:TPR repeat protein [Talaromyces stipitatus ATCC 10500]EED21120.1 TPR repeat protein [Talaromyces stipitatus ATCC 10500]